MSSFRQGLSNSPLILAFLSSVYTYAFCYDFKVYLHFHFCFILFSYTLVLAFILLFHFTSSNSCLSFIDLHKTLTSRWDTNDKQKTLLSLFYAQRMPRCPRHQPTDTNDGHLTSGGQVTRTTPGLITELLLVTVPAWPLTNAQATFAKEAMKS